MNDVPVSADGIVSTVGTEPYQFSVDDFAFADPSDNPPNALAYVRIDALPDIGRLLLNGQPVVAEQMIAVADIGSLVYDTTEPPPLPWFEDSFEGTPPHGWNSVWLPEVNTITTNEGGVPPGGGNYTLRQIWDGVGYSGLNMNFNSVPGIPDLISEGEDFYIRYYLKYDPTFDFGDSPGLKEIIIQGDSEINDRMYVCIDSITSPDAKTYVTFQATDQGGMYSNVNGPHFVMPRGEWVQFEWYVKISSLASQQGVLKGWIDGILRWNYAGIATIKAGNYKSMSINYAFTYGVIGPNQKRYVDLFCIGPGSIAINL